MGLIISLVLDFAIGGLGIGRGRARQGPRTIQIDWAGFGESTSRSAAASGVLLPLLPVAICGVALIRLALHMMDDQTLFFFGAIIGVPMIGVALTVSWWIGVAAMWASTALLQGRPGARWLASAYLISLSTLGWFCFYVERARWAGPSWQRCRSHSRS